LRFRKLPKSIKFIPNVGSLSHCIFKFFPTHFLLSLWKPNDTNFRFYMLSQRSS
jgi:hypothetical protein